MSEEKVILERPHTPDLRLLTLLVLARSFPTFALPHGTRCATPGLQTEFDGEVFSRHLRGMSSGERTTADFLLHVYNHYDYPFDLSRISSWDDAHLAAFAAWARNPFWA